MPVSLRRLRFPVADSRGRRYPEPPHPYRSLFQRDRDRIVHARAFRRLESKTQVFAPGISDHFRNRLTHTIEVSQIARTVANVLEIEEDFAEALALVHDIGHPPFAHAGEAELERQMKRYGEGFDHNLHALRIVETFEQRYPRFPGLNLTFEVREGIVKHSRDLEPDTAGELEEYLPGRRPPLEAQIIDLADEIAYNTADVDDALAASLIEISEIASAVPQFAELYEQSEFRFPGASDREQFHESLRLLFDHLVSGLIEGTRTAAVETGVEASSEVCRLPERLARFTPEAAATNRHLKEFLHTRVYGATPLAIERKRCMEMIAALFQHYCDRPERLPEPYCNQVATKPIHRVVCGYIAGMTDPFLERTYRHEAI